MSDKTYMECGLNFTVTDEDILLVANSSQQTCYLMAQMFPDACRQIGSLKSSTPISLPAESTPVTSSDEGKPTESAQQDYAAEPVAPVEAKEKCKEVSRYGCICLLEAGHKGDHNPKCGWGNHKFPQTVAEPKATPSTPALNITPTFGRPTVEEILQEWSEGRTYGRDSHFIKQFSHHALIYIESLKDQNKPISTEQSAPSTPVSAPQETLLEVLRKAEAFIEDELTVRKQSFLPEGSPYIDEAQTLLDLVSSTISKSVGQEETKK